MLTPWPFLAGTTNTFRQTGHFTSMAEQASSAAGPAEVRSLFHASFASVVFTIEFRLTLFPATHGAKARE